MLFINFKLYPQTFGKGALDLAKTCQQVADETKVKIIPVVSALDLREIKKETGLEVWLQHADIHFQGRHTGYLSPLQAEKAGADGTLFNHSEHELPPGQIQQILSHFENLKIENCRFQTMVCFKTQGQVQNWLTKLKPQPDFLAYEPSELIASKTTSVSQAKPEVIKKIVEMMPESKIIVGAGVKSQQDVKKSLQLGAKGVLVASAVVKSDNPKKKLLELAQGFTDFNN